MERKENFSPSTMTRGAERKTEERAEDKEIEPKPLEVSIGENNQEETSTQSSDTPAETIKNMETKIDLSGLVFDFCADGQIEDYYSEKLREIENKAKWIEENKGNFIKNAGKISEAIKAGLIPDDQPETLWQFQYNKEKEEREMVLGIKKELENRTEEIKKGVAERLSYFLSDWILDKATISFTMNKKDDFCVSGNNITTDLRRLALEEDFFKKTIQGLTHEIFHIWMSEKSNWNETEESNASELDLKDRIIFKIVDEGLAVLIGGQSLKEHHKNQGKSYDEFVQESFDVFYNFVSEGDREKLMKIKDREFQNMGHFYVVGYEMVQALLEKKEIEDFKKLIVEARENPVKIIEQHEAIFDSNFKKNTWREAAKRLSSAEIEDASKKRISFSFSSDSEQFFFSYKDGEPFFMIKFLGSLPEGLSEEDKQRFTKEIREEDGNKKMVYVLKYGEDPESSKGKKDSSNAGKPSLISSPRDFTQTRIKNFLDNETSKETIIKGILGENSDSINRKEISEKVEKFLEVFHSLKDYEKNEFFTFPQKEVDQAIIDEIKKTILPKAQKMDTTGLVDFLQNKKVLFYTGAGISMAGGLPDMTQLQELLGVNNPQETDNSLWKAITNSQAVIDSWKKIAQSFIETPTTSAHRSLAVLVQKLASLIFTENLDSLQEQAGVETIRLTSDWLKQNLRTARAQEIDAVVTIGLSYDDKGFLDWYKKNNPSGKIIAIDLKQPSYLDEEDFMLSGDCQKIIPELAKEFTAEKNL